MPKQNRVTPYGDLIATAARGTFMGNRGVLHNEQPKVVRRQTSQKAWIICVLEFKERKLKIMEPGHYTQLFFLDEATALAAGHRPCFECRREAANAFRQAWTAAYYVPQHKDVPRVGEIDAILQSERLTDEYYSRDRKRVMYRDVISTLPNGTFIEREGKPYLVWVDVLFPWTAKGYKAAVAKPAAEEVTVLTPRSTVGALAHGYVPTIHETARL